ncbi:MAG: RidA family protein [Clostridia bacterium]|nr:RidA family protein [Clostridia bacterium]
MKEIVETKAAPGAIGPYSQAVKTGGLLYTSGQLPVDPETGSMPDSVDKQAEQSLENLKAVVEAGGASMDSVIKTTVFIRHMDDFARINEVYAKYFDAPYPARSCVEVARLPKDALVEIECIAVIG